MLLRLIVVEREDKIGERLEGRRDGDVEVVEAAENDLRDLLVQRVKERGRGETHLHRLDRVGEDYFAKEFALGVGEGIAVHEAHLLSERISSLLRVATRPRPLTLTNVDFPLSPAPTPPRQHLLHLPNSKNSPSKSILTSVLSHEISLHSRARQPANAPRLRARPPQLLIDPRTRSPLLLCSPRSRRRRYAAHSSFSCPGEGGRNARIRGERGGGEGAAGWRRGAAGKRGAGDRAREKAKRRREKSSEASLGRLLTPLAWFAFQTIRSFEVKQAGVPFKVFHPKASY